MAVEQHLDQSFTTGACMYDISMRLSKSLMDLFTYNDQYTQKLLSIMQRTHFIFWMYSQCTENGYCLMQVMCPYMLGMHWDVELKHRLECWMLECQNGSGSCSLSGKHEFA